MSMQKRRAKWSSFKFTEWLQNERKGETAMIRNLYNQVPHLTQDTDGISDKMQENSTYQKTKRPAIFQQVTTRLHKQYHSMAKTRHVPLREAQFLTPMHEFEQSCKVPWVGLQCLNVVYPDHTHI